MPTALVSGVTGQDGSYLVELLLSKGYTVHGLVRRASTFNFGRIDHIARDNFHLHYADLADGASLRRALDKTNPDEVYHLAAQSHVRISFDMAEYTADTVFMGTLRLLESIRDHMDHTGREPRVYLAGSSEMYGAAPPAQDENTPFKPRSPYAIAKVAAFHLGQDYRDAYGMFICNGILFNHESPRRGENFLTRKVAQAAARIRVGLQDKLALGNLDAERDWGYAPEYVHAMWMMLNHDKPDDYVVGTGYSTTVREFVYHTFKMLGLNWEDHCTFDPRHVRPTEVNALRANPAKIRETLGWKAKVLTPELAKIMVVDELETAQAVKYSKDYLDGDPMDPTRYLDGGNAGG